jgi:hypothetical protein
MALQSGLTNPAQHIGKFNANFFVGVALGSISALSVGRMGKLTLGRVDGRTEVGVPRLRII